VINGTNNFNSNAKNTINLVHVLSPPPFFLSQSNKQILVGS